MGSTSQAGPCPSHKEPPLRGGTGRGTEGMAAALTVTLVLKCMIRIVTVKFLAHNS